MKKITCCLFLFLSFINVRAGGNNWLDELKLRFQNFWDKQQPERIYLHTDRSLYAAGDTIWFKAYLTDVQTNNLRLVPEVIYLNLISKANKAVLTQKVKTEMGNATGSIVLPDSLSEGNYLLQANTNWQRNIGPENFYRQLISINKPSQAIKQTSNKIRNKGLKDLQFYPEGGKLITGFNGKVGVKAIAEDGYGIAIEGKILDEAGKLVSGFQCNSDGIGSFKFRPLANKNYTVQVSINSVKRNFPLQILQEGYALAVKQTLDSVYINLNATSGNKQSTTYLVVQGKGNLLVSDSVSFNANGKRNCAFSALNWPEGVTQIYLFNAQGIAQCERLFFKNKKGVQPQLTVSKNAYGRREIVPLNILLKDENGRAIETELSISVTSGATVPSPTLRSSLLLGAELGNIIPGFEQYLANLSALDDLLLTQHQLNLSWEATTKNTPDKNLFPRETDLKNQGIALAENGNVGMAVIYLLDSNTGKTHIVSTDGSGKFTLPVSNATRFFYQVWQNGLFRKDAKLNLITSEVILPTDKWDIAFMPDSALTAQFNLLQRIDRVYNLNAKKPDTLGNSNSVNAWKLPQPDKKYLLEEYSDFNTMEEIFKEIVPSVRIINKKGLTQANMYNSERKDFYSHQPLYIIDGQPTWNNDLFLRLDASQLKEVDVYYSTKNLMPFGFMGNQGVITVQTKNGNYQNPDLKTESILNVPSPQATSQFTTRHIPTNIPDFRPTLYWNPKVQTNTEGKATVNFQTSDEMGNLRVQVEGITKDGQLISEQLIIPVQPAE